MLETGIDPSALAAPSAASARPTAWLRSLANRVPGPGYAQHEVWEAVRGCRSVRALKNRSQRLLEKILTGSEGVHRRYFALDEVPFFVEAGAQELNAAFEREAPALSARALNAALEAAGMRADALDAVLVCTCTGYLCPGVSSFVAEALDLPADTYLQDLVGLGCGAAIPALRAASHLLAARPGAHVAVIAVEVCSACFYLDDDPGVLVSFCLFGDGASASIWSGEPVAPAGLGEDAPALGLARFDTRHLPQKRQLLRFENRGGKLRNRLHRSVPEHAAEAVGALHDRLEPWRPAPGDLISHTGGPDVLAALEKRLDGQTLEASRRTLARFGNMSSPSVLFALEERLRAGPPGQPLWLTAFGAGFSAHGCALQPG